MAVNKVEDSSLVFLRSIFSERVARVKRKAVKVDLGGEMVRSFGTCVVVFTTSGGKTGKSCTIVLWVVSRRMYAWAQKCTDTP